MLAAVHRGAGIQDFLTEFNVKHDIYAVANAKKDVDKSTFTNAWHKLWTTTMFCDDDPTEQDFKGFCVTNEKTISNLITYAKSLSDESVNKLDEADIDNDAPFVHSLSDREITGVKYS